MPKDEEQDEAEEKPAKVDIHGEIVKGGFASFNRRPEAAMLAVVVLAVIGQGYLNYRIQASQQTATDARLDKLVEGRKMERESHEKQYESFRAATKAEIDAQRDFDQRQREREAESAEKRLKEAIDAYKEATQRIVDHLKFLSDAIAKINVQRDVAEN